MRPSARSKNIAKCARMLAPAGREPTGTAKQELLTPLGPLEQGRQVALTAVGVELVGEFDLQSACGEEAGQCFTDRAGLER